MIPCHTAGSISVTNKELCVVSHKIPIISPGLIFAQKAFLVRLIIFRGACTHFWSGVLLEGILPFKMDWT